DQGGEDTELPEKMNDFSITEDEMDLPVTKEVELFGMMDKVTINGKKFDPDRIDFTQEQGETEVWEIYNKRSEEHTSELQSRFDLVCRLLLEKKNENIYNVRSSNRLI